MAASTDTQDGTGDPLEMIDSVPRNDTGNRLVITKAAGAAARFLHLDTFGGWLAISTPGQIHGHTAALNAVSVAAVSVAGEIFPFIGGVMNSPGLSQTRTPGWISWPRRAMTT